MQKGLTGQGGPVVEVEGEAKAATCTLLYAEGVDRPRWAVVEVEGEAKAATCTLLYAEGVDQPRWACCRGTGRVQGC